MLAAKNQWNILPDVSQPEQERLFAAYELELVDATLGNPKYSSPETIAKEVSA